VTGSDLLFPFDCCSSALLVYCSSNISITVSACELQRIGRLLRLLICDFSAKIRPFVISSKALPACLFLCRPLFLPSFRFGFFLSTGLKHAQA
jgi:hypothetical protein